MIGGKSKNGTLTGGGPADPWLQRYADLRQDRNFWRYIAGGLLLLAVLCAGWAIFEARKPHEIPVAFAVDPAGHYMPIQLESVPDEPGKKYLLRQWITAWRSACEDNQQCKDQVAALVLNTAGNLVRNQVDDYTQSVGSKKVNALVRGVYGSGYDYQVDWDESVDGKPPIPMRAYITIAFGDRFVSRHSDTAMNPYGMFITQPIRIVPIGG